MQLLASEAEAALLIEFTNVGKEPSTGQAVSAICRFYAGNL